MEILMLGVVRGKLSGYETCKNKMYYRLVLVLLLSATIVCTKKPTRQAHNAKTQMSSLYPRSASSGTKCNMKAFV